jgi:hypothetical protein
METSIETNDPRNSVWFLAGVLVAGVGALFLFSTEDGRKVRRQLLSWTEEAQRRLTDLQEALEVARQLCEGELPDATDDAPRRPLRVVKEA